MQVTRPAAYLPDRQELSCRAGAQRALQNGFAQKQWQNFARIMELTFRASVCDSGATFRSQYRTPMKGAVDDLE